MAPVRKSRSVNKRFINEASPGKNVGKFKKSKQRKKKLSDKLGPQWSRGELERFYEAYRKHGQDWKKVAAVIRHGRSVDMVEALFNMNRAYLSLPEGTASVAGLIAMMTDHYSVMEGSGSEGEGNDASEVPKRQYKQKDPKPQLSDSEGEGNGASEVPKRQYKRKHPKPQLSDSEGEGNDASEVPKRKYKRKHPKPQLSDSEGEGRKYKRKLPKPQLSDSEGNDASESKRKYKRKLPKPQLSDSEYKRKLPKPQLSDSEGEGNDASEVPRRRYKRKRPKPQLSDSREEVDITNPTASTDGCLTYLKQARANALRSATGKRTPRIPIQTSSMRDDREESTPPSKRARKQVDFPDDYAHCIALALTDASKRGGSPKVSESPSRRKELSESSPINSWGKMMGTRKTQSKYRDSSMLVGSSRERKLESDTEGVDELEVPRKVKNTYKRKVKVEEAEGNDSDGDREACSATQGFRIKSQRRKATSRGTYLPRSRSPKKRDKKLTSGDEFDALQALAELSASLLPGAFMKESSAQLKEERTENDMDEKSSTPEATSTSSDEERADADDNSNKSPKPSRQSTDYIAVTTGKLQPQPTSGSLRRKRKPKRLEDEAPTYYSHNKTMHKKELAQEENNIKTLVRTKRSGPGLAQSRQLKTVKPLEESFITIDKKSSVMDEMMSTIQDNNLGPASLSQKPPHRRKANLKKSLQERARSFETIPKASRRPFISLSEQELLLKEELSTCLSYPLARRRCIFEWFYSAIDQPWFAKMEFVDYLNHVGLGHIPRLTRLEWSVIKSSLGRPRRFSERFLQEEREKLTQYRESVRKHYTEFRIGAREGLPIDLARPLAVGNRVIAIHPKTREIRDGKILTVDHNKCNVVFDDDTGVELVMDIDCMPTNALEYLSGELQMRIDKCLFMKKEPQINGNSNLGLSVIFPPPRLENIDFSLNPSLNQVDMIAPILHGKVATTSRGSQQTTQSYIRTYSTAREAEIERAIALHHALHDKEMEPEILQIVNGSKTKAQAMVDTAIKAASSVKEGENGIKVIQEALNLIGKHQPLHSSMAKHQEHANGSTEQHHNPTLSEPMANNGAVSQDSVEKSEAQMPSELITSCVATWLMIQMCTERHSPPAEVAQLIDTAVTSLQPRCPQNLPIYREIQTCLGRIKTQILSLIPT